MAPASLWAGSRRSNRTGQGSCPKPAGRGVGGFIVPLLYFAPFGAFRLHGLHVLKEPSPKHSHGASSTGGPFVLSFMPLLLDTEGSLDEKMEMLVGGIKSNGKGLHVSKEEEKMEQTDYHLAETACIQ